MQPPDIVRDEARLAALDSYDILDSEAEPGFDGIVRLASTICATPVALVSLVASDRQWFKARIGFEPCETEMGSSVCAHALVEPDLLVITDLTKDPRSSQNALVTGEPHIRFYAGAPLRSPEGHVLGSLCVIDGKPRPEGLTEQQSTALRDLAVQVVAQLELRRSVIRHGTLLTECQAISEQLNESEKHWRGLFEELSEGFIVGQLVRDLDGKAIDWRYVEVNAAWADLVGVAAEDAIGRTVREVFRGIEDEWISSMAAVVETGAPIKFTRQVGVLQRWYEGRAFPLKGERFGVIFLEVTDRTLADIRRSSLLDLGDRMREAGSVDEMVQSACDIVGEALGASRVAFGTLDHTGEFVDIGPNWLAAGMDSIEGRHRFADYGNLLEELVRGEPLVIDDVRSDPRTAADPSRMQALGIGALVNIPVRERGRTAAVLTVHEREPQVWSAEVIAFLRNVADRVQAGIEKLRAEEQQEVLNLELSHRMKNMMAMVQAMATQTLKPVTERGPVEALEKRILAMSAAHDVLLQESWSSADLGTVASSALATFALGDRCRLAGPKVEIGPRATLSVSMLLHELATNAFKYGSLTADGGAIEVGWRVDGAGEDAELKLSWRETGGPAANPSKGRGFGSRLIAMGLVGTGGSDVRYGPMGLECDFTAPLKQVQQS